MSATRRMGAAAVLARFREPLEVREFALPERLEPGAWLVRTQMAGICGTDVHLWKGELPIQLPVILGHETVGVLAETGGGADRDWTGAALAPGDRVTWNSTVSCGACFYCAEKGQPTRCPSRRAYGIGYRCDEPPHFLGGYADYHYLRPGTTLFRIPDALSTEAVVGSGCALITAIHGVERVGVGWQDRVVVQGAGPVGIAALAVAKSAGASQVILIGAPSGRLELASRFGATAVLDLNECADPRERIERIRRMTGGHGADVVIECTGSPPSVPEGLEMCRDGGRYLVLGHYADAGPIPLNPHVITRKQLQIFGSWSSEPRHLRAALGFLERHQDAYPFAQMISHRFGVREADAALATTAALGATKCVIVPGD